jgi:hypothetical protein
MTDGAHSMPESDDRAAEKPRRGQTLRSSVPPHGGAVAPLSGGEYIKRIPVGRLETVPQWRRLVGRIMRAMLRAELSPDVGTKLIWAARVGADMAKAEQEQRALEEINEKLARLEGGEAPPLPGGLRTLSADDLSELTPLEARTIQQESGEL